ncbi:hypothetical protein [Streptomyces sp. CC210A]|uniref:golvesin C-terminal-like domain-containing protein n=1 Tax=Streptomyces sp. CC210A TaxID=2898184 RepID=UPI001F17E1DB|nr:hypothetical protein [Streptomyces sp. CC210A]
MSIHIRARLPLAALAATAVLGGTLQPAAQAAEPAAPTAGPGQAPAPSVGSPGGAKTPGGPDAVPPAERTSILGEDYRKSGDLAWTTTGDAQGFHLLTAREKDGYTWKTAASLSEPGFDTDAWIGNVCVTGSGKRAVVVYAPRTFTNKPQLMARGGFTAVVELETGKVTKLPLQASLSYYNPGCGVGEEAVLTQSGGEDKAATRLFKLNAATGVLSKPIETKGQVTSAVVAEGGTVVGANGARIVRIDAKGRKTALVQTESVPYRLAPDADGGLVFLDKREPGTGNEAEAKGKGKARVTRSAFAAAPAASGPAAPEVPQTATTRAKRITAGQIGKPDAERAEAAVLAEGPLTETGVTQGAGTVYLTGAAVEAPGAKLPETVRRLDEAPKDAKVSTRGEAVLTETTWTDGQGALLRSEDAEASRPVNVKLTVVDSGKQTTFTVDPAKRVSEHSAEGRARTPALDAPRAGDGDDGGGMAAQGFATRALSAGGRHEVVESERVCSVPRNDPRNQVVQPKPRQVEWAVNRAVKGELNKYVSRPANWRSLGMPAYQPQSLFPRVGLEGGGTVPYQVMLGITAAESNMQQASRVAVPGVAANPTIGNYYGIDYYDGEPLNDWDIDWAEADCGYGITQVTDHMRLAGREGGKGGKAWDYQKQRAVALDYTANIAAGLQILSEKWNQTRRAGLIANNGDVSKPENWYFALWSYNSGFYPDKGDGSPWGVGWANNPANPEWDAGRTPFMEDFSGTEEPHDAAHPQDWPYQEKVLGFAAHPPAYLEAPGKMVPAFRPASWNGLPGPAQIPGTAKHHRAQLKAPEGLFCTEANQCDPGRISDDARNGSGAGPCMRGDFKCWWNQPVEWKKDCDYSCGVEFRRFPDGWAEEADGNAYPPNCTRAGLPSGAKIVDDLPEGTPSLRPGCSNSSWTNEGTFTLDFGEGEIGAHPSTGGQRKWPAKVDLHQLGAGFGGHFYFAHTRKNDAKGQRLKTTASWKLDKPLSKPDARVWVHLPDHGAHTKVARYEIKTTGGWVTAIVSQPGDSNRWVDIGVYRFSDGVPEVRLSNITEDGTGDQDIAFDAVAFEEGDFSQIPDIRFPDADPNAPEPEAFEPPVVIPGNFLDLDSLVGRSASAVSGADGVRPARAVPSSKTCGTVDKARQEVICIGPGPGSGPLKDVSAKRTARKAPDRSEGAPAARSAAAATETVACSLQEASVSYTRTYACMTGQLILERITAGRPTGQAIWDYRHEIQLDATSADIVQTVSLDMKSTAGIKNVTLGMDFDCLGACQSEPTQWQGSRTWQAGDRHTLTGYKRMKWTGTSGHSSIYPSWKFTGTMDGRAGEPIERDKSELEIRCDLEAKSTRNKPGCVFPRYIPTYVVNTAKDPSASAFYWIVQQKLPSHPGSRPHGKPLTYNSDSAQGTSNRDVICPRSGSDRFVPHPDSNAGGKRGGGSCDEYPFATTYESGAMPVSAGGGGVKNGTECLQLYAKKPTAGTNNWTLHEDTSYPRRNTWKEPCGRASVPGDENSGAANRIGIRFVPANRILDKDRFYVLTPGFEECKDLKQICWVRTRK